MKSQDKTNLLRQILVPGIIDYNNLFVEATESTVQDESGRPDRCDRCLINGEETVIMKMSDISSVYVEQGSSYYVGESRTIIVTLQNKFRYSFTYETGNAIRLLWKRHMKSSNVAFNFEDDQRYLSKVS